MTSSPHVAVRAAVAPLLGDARISTSLTSQLLAGETVAVIEQRGDWLHVHGEDGYEGWTHAGYVGAASGGEHTWRISLGCTIRESTSTTRMLPLGARVAPSAEVVNGIALAAETRETRFARDSGSIAVSAATLYAGASYLWGGVTPWGCDCSGFVQRIFRLHGIGLPRDAWQQASIGTLISDDAAAAHHPGDLLFFTDRDDRRVTHVGIALGDARIVHSSLTRGGVAIERMDGDDPYVERLRSGCTGVQRVI